MPLRNPHNNDEELKRLYENDNKTFEQLAADLGISMGTVGRRLRMAGAVIRPAIKRSAVVDHPLVARLYQDDNLSVEKIAGIMSVSAADITKSLELSGIVRRSRTAHRKPKYPKLSSLQIGESFDIPKPPVKQPQTCLYGMAAKLGIRIAFKTIDTETVRITRMAPALPKKQLDIGEIVRFYQDELLTIVEVAKRIGTSGTTVRRMLKVAGVNMRQAAPRGKI